MRRIAITAALLLPLIAHAGGIKKWVDEDGNVHFGDAPPPKAQVESVYVEPAYDSSDGDGSYGVRDSERLWLMEQELGHISGRGEHKKVSAEWLRRHDEKTHIRQAFTVKASIEDDASSNQLPEEMRADPGQPGRQSAESGAGVFLGGTRQTVTAGPAGIDWEGRSGSLEHHFSLPH